MFLVAMKVYFLLGIFWLTGYAEGNGKSTASLGPSGLVIINKDGRNGSICGLYFSEDYAKVLCRMLGLPSQYAKTRFLGLDGLGAPESFGILNVAGCTGSENNIDQCGVEPYWQWAEEGYLYRACEHKWDIGVSCEGNATETSTGGACSTYQYRGYQFVVWKRNWLEALKSCLMSGAILTAVRNEDHSKWLASESQKTFPGKWWIGMNDILNENKFTTFETDSHQFKNWHRGEPNGSVDENCVQLGNFAAADGLSDSECEMSSNYICEYYHEECKKMYGLEETYTNGKTYYLIGVLKSWHDARGICQLIASDLASIDDEFHAAWLNEKALSIADNYWWIGLNDIKKQGKFEWSNNSTSSYRKFSESPWSEESGCVYFDEKAEFIIELCDEAKVYFICE